MKIQSMRLENYRCFSDLSINFDERLTVLVGENGAGKTAVLDAVVFFLKNYCSFRKQLADNIAQRSIYLLSHDFKLGSTKLELSYTITGTDDTFDFSFQKNNISNKSENENLNAYGNIIDFIKNSKKTNYESPLLLITVYYTAKRILDIEFPERDSDDPMYYRQYDKAFNPQIDFSASSAWFIAKDGEEARAARDLENPKHTIPELSAVRKAVATALGDYNAPRVKETPPKLFITHKDHPDQLLQIEQLSDGYRTMLALVMDLARRMAQANEKFNWPEGQGVLHSPAVVLIDEVELHLHPSWQQRVLPSLMEIFPNAQFIVSTHSPQILSSIAAKHIRVLKDGEVFSMNEETEGAKASRVLEDVFGVDLRPIENEFVQMLQEYSRFVQAGKWDDEKAKSLRTELDRHYRGSEPDLQKLDLYIKTEKWKRVL